MMDSIEFVERPYKPKSVLPGPIPSARALLFNPRPYGSFVSLSLASFPDLSQVS